MSVPKQTSAKPRGIKILCTLGPASLNADVIQRLDIRGVDYFRINLSHTPLEKLEECIGIIRESSQTPICIDSEGAQIRTGTLPGKMSLSVRSRVVLTAQIQAGPNEISLWPSSVFESLRPGHLLSVDFDSALLLIEHTESGRAHAIVLNAGVVGSNKAVSLFPPTSLPALSQKDRAAVDIARKHGIVDFALSFANEASDVDELRLLAGKSAKIVAKIESKSGVRNLDAILDAADSILIDRGDLSREVPLENLPMLQKMIIRKANTKAKPVYVATNLLESMLHSRKPTRAELNDVMNTLIDGANGLVLAAETAIGEQPVLAVDILCSLIAQHARATDGCRIEDLLEASTDLLPPFHGSRPGIRPVSSFPGISKIPDLVTVEISEEAAMDAEQIGTGGFSPVSGFMGHAEISSVLARHRLQDGTVWTMPIVLQLKSENARNVFPGMAVRLVRAGGAVVATLCVQEKFRFDADDMAGKWFGTNNRSHPGVQRLLENGEWLVSGPIQLEPSQRTFQSPYNLTPAQSRMIFSAKSWSKVVGFHTRNIPHQGHEFLIRESLLRSKADGIFIHPVVGPKKPGDFSADIVMEAYDRLLSEAYPDALLGAFSSYPRFGGPREAVFTALCRKNYGCSHFIVGRDHSGVGDFYPEQGSRRLFEELGEIGITPLFFDRISYCTDCESVLEGCGHTDSSRKAISGTQVREALRKGGPIPGWLMRPSIGRWLESRYLNDPSVFI